MKKLLIITIAVAILLAPSLSSTAFAARRSGDKEGEAFTEWEPVLQVNIPGINNDSFTGSVIRGNSSETDDCADDKVCIETINVYLNAVFRFGVASGTIFAIVLIMIGGVEYMVGSSIGGIEKAKKRMKGASIGLLLLLSTTAIVTFINPNAAMLKGLQVPIPKDPPAIKKGDYKTAEGGSVERDIVNAEGEIVKGVNPYKDADGILNPNLVDGSASDSTMWIHEDALIALQRTAEELNNKSRLDNPTKLELLTTYISPEQAAKDFYSKCIRNNCAQEPICNPFPKDSVVEGNYEEGFNFTSTFAKTIKHMEHAEIRQILGEEAKKNQTSQCPFQTGYGVSVICEGDSISKATASCQLRLESRMKANGFCRSYYQPWLYEFGGKTTLTSTENCDWVPGTILLEDPDNCTKKSGAPITYAQGKTSKCARNYADELFLFEGDLICLRSLTNSDVNLTNGKCL